MKRKLTPKRIIRLALLAEAILFILLSFTIYSAFFPSTKTYEAETSWRPNGLWDVGAHAGLNSTFTLKRDQTLQNISFVDGSLRMMRSDTDYGINVTSGADLEINVWYWYEDSATIFEVTSTGTYNATLDVGALGEPTTVTGTDWWTYGSNQVNFTATASSSQFLYFLWGSYAYTFHGVFNETTGFPIASGCDVYVFYTDGTSPDTFFLNGTHVYVGLTEPDHFVFDLTNPREYWLSQAEQDNPQEIWVFDDDTTVYTIVFLDLAGALDDYPYVYAQYYVNGTLYTVEKRQVDVEKKIQMSLVNGRKYFVRIVDGSSYTFGDLLMTDTTTVQLTLKGIDFPKETLLTYAFVRIYGDRGFGVPNGNISLTYQDTLNQTVDVEIYVNYKNGTNAYNATETVGAFVHTWSSALNNTDYAVSCDINHTRYGVFTWNQFYPRYYDTAPPWGLSFFGILPFDTAIIIPSLIIMMVAGCFSVINAEVGAFMAVVTAVILTYLGWIPIPAGALITAFCLAIMMAIIYSKRRIRT